MPWRLSSRATRSAWPSSTARQRLFGAPVGFGDLGRLGLLCFFASWVVTTWVFGVFIWVLGWFWFGFEFGLSLRAICNGYISQAKSKMLTRSRACRMSCKHKFDRRVGLRVGVSFSIFCVCGLFDLYWISFLFI